MRFRRQRGGTVVEAAVSLLVLFTLLMGIMEFGRAWNIYQVLTNAAREGARLSVAPQAGTANLPTVSQVQSQVQTFLNSGNVGGATVTVDQAKSQTVNGIALSYTKVSVSAPYRFSFFPFGQFTLSSQAVMRNETN